MQPTASDTAPRGETDGHRYQRIRKPFLERDLVHYDAYNQLMLENFDSSQTSLRTPSGHAVAGVTNSDRKQIDM
jgi:hypothetical protein